MELANADVSFVRSSGGAFEIIIDGQLRFSKLKTGRFPTDAEIAELAKPQPIGR